MSSRFFSYFFCWWICTKVWAAEKFYFTRRSLNSIVKVSTENWWRCKFNLNLKIFTMKLVKISVEKLSQNNLISKFIRSLYSATVLCFRCLDTISVPGIVVRVISNKSQDFDVNKISENRKACQTLNNAPNPSQICHKRRRNRWMDDGNLWIHNKPTEETTFTYFMSHFRTTGNKLSNSFQSRLFYLSDNTKAHYCRVSSVCA